MQIKNSTIVLRVLYFKITIRPMEHIASGAAMKPATRYSVLLRRADSEIRSYTLSPKTIFSSTLPEVPRYAAHPSLREQPAAVSSFISGSLGRQVEGAFSGCASSRPSLIPMLPSVHWRLPCLTPIPLQQELCQISKLCAGLEPKWVLPEVPIELTKNVPIRSCSVSKIRRCTHSSIWRMSFNRKKPARSPGRAQFHTLS